MSNNPQQQSVAEVLGDAEQFVWAATEELRSAASHLVASTDETDVFLLHQVEDAFRVLSGALHQVRSARTRSSSSNVTVQPRFLEQIDKLRQVRDAEPRAMPEGA